MASIAFCFTRGYQVPKSVGQVAEKHWRTADPCRQDDQPKKPCGVPNRGVPNRGVPSRGVPEPGVRNRGVPERGVPERGVPTRGVPTRGTGGSVIYTAREECWVVCVCCWMWSMFEYNKLFTCWNMLSQISELRLAPKRRQEDMPVTDWRMLAPIITNSIQMFFCWSPAGKGTKHGFLGMASLKNPEGKTSMFLDVFVISPW